MNLLNILLFLSSTSHHNFLTEFCFSVQPEKVERNILRRNTSLTHILHFVISSPILFRIYSLVSHDFKCNTRLEIRVHLLTFELARYNRNFCSEIEFFINFFLPCNLLQSFVFLEHEHLMTILVTDLFLFSFPHSNFL